MQKIPAPHLLIAGAFCAALYVLGIYCRPLFPVDETRYLTVAWEMFTSRDFLVPHLNHEAYDHKPPLLFWSINLIWGLFGVSQEAAMAVPFLFAFALVFFTQRLARHILPEDKYFPTLITYLLIGSLPFIVYSNMIMFDLILGVFSVIGLTAIWDYAKTNDRKHLYIFALAIGLGAITKGPVILLHTIFPILFVKIWLHKDRIFSAKSWAGGFIVAILGGIFLGLCWAVPAAIKGGPAFAEKIFWGQTAERFSDTSDHRHPLLWYFYYLPLVLMPWIFSPLFWRGLKRINSIPEHEAIRFLAVWLLPVFLSFCIVSGKQVHYLIPLIPGFVIFTGLAFRHMSASYRPRDALIPFIFIGLLILMPWILKMTVSGLGLATTRPLLLTILAKVTPIIPLSLFILSSILVLVFSRQNMRLHVLALSLSGLLLMTCFQLESKDSLFKNYDIRPIAEIVKRNPHIPLAFARNYHGEWGFMARLDRPVKELDPPFLPQWFLENPDGLAFMRTGHPQELIPYDVIFSMPYKMNNTYNIVVPKGRAEKYAK